MPSEGSNFTATSFTSGFSNGDEKVAQPATTNSNAIKLAFKENKLNDLNIKNNPINHRLDDQFF